MHQAAILGPQKQDTTLIAIRLLPKNLADEIAKEVDGFKCDFSPDVRQKYADSWPDSLDGSVAKQEWNWFLNLIFDAMVRAMLDGMTKK